MKTSFPLLAIAFVLFSLSAQAQSTWNGSGTDSNWSTGANWIGGVAPISATTTDIRFAGSTSLSPVTDSAFTVRTLNFNSGAGAFTLSGSLISIQGQSSRSIGIINNSTNTETVGNQIKLLGQAGFLASSGDLILNGGIDLNQQASGVGAQAGKTLTLNGSISSSTGAAATFWFNQPSNKGTVVITSTSSFNTSGIFIADGTIKTSVGASNSTNGAFGNNTATLQMGFASGAVTPTLLTSAAVTISKTISLIASSSGTSTFTIGGATADVSGFGQIDTNNYDTTAAQALTVTAASGGRVNITKINRNGTATGSADNVTKVGLGIVALTGASNFSGTTIVTAGTLLVNGSLSGGSVGSVQVNASAILGGTGTTSRSVTIDNSGILAPGDVNAGGASLGGKLTLGVTASSGLSLSGSSVLRFDLATAASTTDDEVLVNGNLVLDGLLEVTEQAGFGNGTYRLFTYTGSVTDNGLTISSLPGFVGSIQVDTLNSAINLVVIPEPSSGTLVLFGSVGMFVMLRVARRRSV